MYCVMLSFFSAYAQNSVQEHQQKLNVLLGKTVPDFRKKSLKGSQYELRALRGQVVVLNFWFAACGPCVKEIPILNEIAEKYHSENITFLALSLDTKEFLSQWTKRRIFKYHLIPSSRDIAQLYGVRFYPTHIIIDTEGIVRFIKVGYHLDIKEILEREIDKLLEE